MKKLMMALAVVACAMSVQASYYNWKMVKGQIFEAGSTTEKVAQGTTAYLINSSFSQADLLKALFVDKTMTLGQVSTKAISGANASVGSSATIPVTGTWEYNGVAAENTWTAYYAIVSGDNIYLSELSPTITASALEDPTAIAFQTNPKIGSQAAAMDGSKGFSGNGWYTAAPEPTSGLLLLIGMAGLALRRRRA